MTKIYEALEQAKKKRLVDSEPDRLHRYSQQLERQYQGPGQAAKSGVSSPLNLKGPLNTLYQNINSLLADKQCKTLQFISARPREGTSLLIREFAKVCALQFRKKVLLVDIEAGGSNQLMSLSLNADTSWLEQLSRGESVRQSIKQIGNTSLYVSCIMSSNVSLSLEVNTSELNDAIEDLENEFHYILIDTPSRFATSDIALLSNRVSGFVIVVEAEKTRWQVVEKLRDKLLGQGANILGVLFNKRTFPIPEFVYKRL